MKRVLVTSVFDAVEYVMQHYYPAGMEDMVEKSDTYAVISIQDSHTDGFGVTFSKNQYCKAVLTLKFDDIIRPVEDAQLFTEDMAEQIICFIKNNKDVDTLLIHCYAGQSRSRAVGAFAVKMLGGDNSIYFTQYSPNMHVYSVLEKSMGRVDAKNDHKLPIDDLIFDIRQYIHHPEARFTENTIPDMDRMLRYFCERKPEAGMHISYLDKAEELANIYKERFCNFQP